jgi:hypothetical protein
MKVQAYEIRARPQRRVSVVGSGYAADFDLDTHGAPLMSAARQEIKEPARNGC